MLERMFDGALFASMSQDTAMIAQTVNGGVISAGGAICIGFGVLALLLASWAAFNSTRDTARRQLYVRLVGGTALGMIVLATIAMLAISGVWPPWTMGTAVAVWLTLAIPSLIWFNGQIRQSLARQGQLGHR